MTIDTNRLRELLEKATPGPILLATSNSWRRIESMGGGPVCEPCKQPDGHPDLHFRNGGFNGPDALLLIEAWNALPALLDELERLTERDEKRGGLVQRQGAEITRLMAETDLKDAEVGRLRGLVAEMAENDNYETEYDGRMYSICHGCGAQGGENHRRQDCLYLRARAALNPTTSEGA